MTSHEYEQKWCRNAGENDAIECYEDFAIDELQELLDTLTPANLEEATDLGCTHITNIAEWRDAISAALEARRAAQGGTP